MERLDKDANPKRNTGLKEEPRIVSKKKKKKRNLAEGETGHEKGRSF